MDTHSHQQNENTTSAKQDKSLRGFAAMDREKQKEIASKGGRAAHERGTAHKFTSEEARSAGRKGGEAVSKDRQHMAAIGREGGKSRKGLSHAGTDKQDKDTLSQN